MAVYTHIDEAALSSFLSNYEVGTLVSFSGIMEGIDNTNYRVETDRGHFILTLFEKRIKPGDLPFYINFMAHLQKNGIPCPAVAATKEGETITPLAGKPAVITSFLKGEWPRQIEAHHCMTLGRVLGHMHNAAKSYLPKRRNDLSLPTWRALIDACRDEADRVQPGLYAHLDEELRYLESNWPRRLPSGAVHADLFPDNVFFEGERMTGVIDFYFSCTEFFAYDLMITMNAWCFDKAGELDTKKSQALLAAYQNVRPLSKAEIKALPLLARASAMRIIATRLYDWLNPAPGALIKAKDPLEHVYILRFHQKIKSAEAYGLAA